MKWLIVLGVLGVYALAIVSYSSQVSVLKQQLNNCQDQAYELMEKSK